MVGLLVITHGRLAEELVNAARTVVPDAQGLAAVSIGWDDDVEAASKRIREEIGRLDDGDGVAILTDMFGGTPTNLAMSFHEPGSVEIVTGVNLPMLIKFLNLRDEVDAHSAARRIAEQGRQAIQVASELLESDGGDAS